MPTPRTRTALDTAITAGDTATAAKEAEAIIAALTDGRRLTPLDMLKLGHARRTLAQIPAAHDDAVANAAVADEMRRLLGGR